jgi:hypothetical protein
VKTQAVCSPVPHVRQGFAFFTVWQRMFKKRKILALMDDQSDSVMSSEFRFLLEERGVRVTIASENCSEVVLGNLVIQFARDRLDYINILVASVHEEQSLQNLYIEYPLSVIRAVVLKTDPAENPPITELASFLRTHLPDVDSMFSKSNLKATKAALDMAGHERAKKLFPD